MGILITGAAGLIGSTLVKKLENQGHEVISCDIRFHNNPLSFFSEDIVPLLAKCTGIIHLAAISRVIHGELYPELCRKINVDGTMQFLGLCKSLSNKPWFIYASSREVYGEQKELPVTESASIDPINNYAKGKAFIEEQITSSKDFNVAILRFSNVYGGLLDHNSRVIPALCINALRGDPIKIEGKECVFDFTYLDDVIEGICLTVKYLQSEKSSLPAIHLTTNSPCTLENLAKTILKVTKSDSRIDFYPPRNFDVTKFHGDFTRAKELLGWSPKHSLEVGLSKFIKSLQNNTQQYPNNIDMVIYENIKSYSWLPSLL
ncbi:MULTISPECIES: NAD-dependent epimerase/dehydratase family protein [unclassified Wolbachia]|uniref:NAD-dependent epimerase/dehydratase family protein n=1 Tax=unclassified Wolbachia TaxID=2640676 RepID=UPI0007EEB67D|nr:MULTISPECIES: NAD(P)-dependent oxidoreductase [unclassified Wolbachia]MDE5065163.1 NAD(P)-dependent oxidoreductase [Wolbachia endosymbiont of Drosophila tristis]MDU8920731.1 NAD(P)-dependent oxidoreductase [Wolbachia endosymbiont of Drosophila tristis]MDX5495553.1 NAD(P)-dependent oxidoreductase [Wolbachia endosymbiont of Nomada marshamella]